jgi:hypothetical protein
MPRSWNGRWCFDPLASVRAPALNQDVYYPPDLSESGKNYEDRVTKTCPSNYDSIVLDLDGYDEDTQGDTQTFCAFTEVREKERGVSYLVHARCKVHDADDEAIIEEDVEFQLINDLLFIKRKPEG